VFLGTEQNFHHSLFLTSKTQLMFEQFLQQQSQHAWGTNGMMVYPLDDH